MTARLNSTQPAMGSLHAKATEEVPIGHTTVLSTSDLARIKNTLLTQAATTMGQSIKSEVHSTAPLPFFPPGFCPGRPRILAKPGRGADSRNGTRTTAGGQGKKQLYWAAGRS